VHRSAVPEARRYVRTSAEMIVGVSEFKEERRPTVRSNLLKPSVQTLIFKLPAIQRPG